MKYEIINGIIHEDGRPTFALGASYYPSFLPSKYPVPESGDRLGEMRKDFKLMRECGMQFVRCAALGTVEPDGDSLRVDTPFIDEMAREAEKVGLGLSVRLNGYFVNLSGNENYEFVNNAGEAMEKYWSAFMQSSFFHKGARRDNYAATKALAGHFSRFDALISYQIYNEPHYPYNGVFDYNPATIRTYREWLAEKGVIPVEAAESYEPPRERPHFDSNKFPRDKVLEWVRWREFSCKAMSDFLDETARAAHEALPGIDCYTCYTTSHSTNRNANAGVTFFDDAKDLTTLAFTHYTGFDGAEYFPAAYIMSLAESAAAVYGKHAWSAELDARTKMPSRKFYQSTYSVIGSGCKGICYYAWRGDYPDPATPWADNCGFLHYDGSKTERFDRDVKLLLHLKRYSELIAKAEKLRQGVAILHSDRANYYFDAVSGSNNAVNLWVFLTIQLYRELRQEGFDPDFLRAKDLEENRLGVKYLFVPALRALSEEEKKELEKFEKSGGKVFAGDLSGTFDAVVCGGYFELSSLPGNRVTEEFRGGAQVSDIIEHYKLAPPVQTNSRNLFAGVLAGDGYKIVTLVSNEPYAHPIKPHEIKLNFAANHVIFAAPERETELEVKNGFVMLPEISDAAMLIIR